MLYEKCLAELDYNYAYMDQCGVYLICCEPTGKVYVGASVHIVKRIREHFYSLEKGVHRNPRLRSAYKQYGEDSFSSEVVLYCDPINLELYGKQIIEKLQPEFNIVNTENTNGGFVRRLRAASEEIKRGISILQQLEKIQKRTHRF